MNYSNKYTLSDTNFMTWNEFGSITEKLVGEIRNYLDTQNITFDAIAPILRNGSVPGTIIANKLDVTTFLPIQLKYDYKTHKPIQLLPFYKPLHQELRNSPNILVVECNTFSGESAKLAAQIVRQEYREAALYYATVGQVYRKEPVDFSHIHIALLE